MDYEKASVEQITDHFETISRQRIQQVLRKFTLRRNEAVVAKITQAKKLLKERKYLKKNGCTLAQRSKCESLWYIMTQRVGKSPAYLDCTNGFASFQEFKDWAVRQIGFGVEGFELDKDVLIKGNRVYSPSTCVFIPLEINSLLSGCYKAARRGKYPIGVCFNKGSGRFVAQMSSRQDRGLDKYLGSFGTVEEAFACYKQAKEAKIRRLAEKWKNQIDPRAYEALMKRTVEMDD